MKRIEIYAKFFVILFLASLVNANVYATCTGTTTTWQGSTNTWNSTSNWDTGNIPDTSGEDVVIVGATSNLNFDTDATIGCLTLSSGTATNNNGVDITITGSSFSAAANTLSTTGSNFKIIMGGSSAQTVDVVDDIRDFEVTNPTTVTLANSFRIRREIDLSGGGTLNIEADITSQRTGSHVTIPAGETVVIKSTGSFYSRGGMTVNGTLRIEGGGLLKLYRDTTLTIGSGGILQLDGSEGNPAQITSEGVGKIFTFNMNGTLEADYFSIDGMGASGMNVSGTISNMDHGEFRRVADTGYLITLQSTANIPSTSGNLAFYNDDSVATPGNIDASLYNGSLITISDFSGDIPDETYESDTNNKIDWAAAAATELAISDEAESSKPGTYFDPGDIFTFAEFAFALTQSDTATDITSIDITMVGTGSISDLDYVYVYVDTNGNCNHNNAADTFIQELTFSGSPPVATVTFSSGDIQTDGPSDKACFSIRAEAADTATDTKTIQFAIQETSDVTNSEGYDFSTTAAPPITAKATTIRNPNYATWEGSTNVNWSEATNWAGGAPSSILTCYVASGSSIPEVDTTPIACANAILQSGGELDWNSTTNEFDIYGDLEIQSSFTFTAAGSSLINMVGTTVQSISASESIPNNLVIDNSGAAQSNVVTITSDLEILGDLICREGVLNLPDGHTLTVNGDLTIESGCELDLDAGSTLVFANGSTLTVNSGGTLTMVGSSSKNVTITSENSSSTYTVQVDGDIAARYYAFTYLSTSGVTVSSTATIDGTNYLQDGSFSQPVNSNTTFLNLEQQIPGNTLSDMSFDTSGKSLSNLINVDTTGASAGTLTISNYSGDLSGPSFDTDPSYNISWSGQTTNLEVTVETGPEESNMRKGNTYMMGGIGFKIADAGASYNDTDITSVTIELDGNGTAGDVSGVSLYSDSDCDQASGSLLGSTTFSGSPSSATFSISGGTFTVASHPTTTVKNCMYVEFTIDSGATNGNTLGFKISATDDYVNSEAYSTATETPAPFEPGTESVYVATSTTWTGTTSSVWDLEGNWSDGVPSSETSCTIVSSSNDPIISSGTEQCLSLTVSSGTLTISSGATLEIYKNITNNSTITNNGTLEITDSGSATTHSISSSSTIASLDITKTGGGSVATASSNIEVTNLNLSGSNFSFLVADNTTLVLPNGLSLSSGSFEVDSGGELNIGNGQDITISGGTFSTSGTNDVFPQVEGTKAKIDVDGSGTWGFTATSGTVSLVGFHFDNINTDGINIGGTTTLSALNGGQITNLSSSYSSVKGIQLNTTGSIPSTSNNVAWVWGNFNSFDPVNTNTPDSTESYTLVSSTGCSSQTIDFEGWTGDWYETEDTFDVSSKVSASGCSINMSASASSVQLLSFDAYPYNQKVDIRWETNLEKNHKGFNVYRSDLSGSSFVQVNSELIRNLNNYASKRGKYRFIDNDVVNDTIYLYYIEDVEINGKISLHGPVSATPESSLGDPPALGDHNSDTNNDDDLDGGSSDGGTISNPSYRDLGNGVVIRHQTSSSLLLEIELGDITYTTSAWDNSYQDVSIDGYSVSGEAGEPALPERVLFIEVDEFINSAELIDSSLTTSESLNHLISPVPHYNPVEAGQLEASYNPSASLYATDDYLSSSHFVIQNEIVESGSKKFLKVTLNPFRYNPVQEKILQADSIKIEIGFNDNGWDIEPNSQLAIGSLANLLRIQFAQSGMYEIGYDDLSDNDLEYPFSDVDIDELTLYLREREIPIEISSADNIFNSGDKLRFFLSYEDHLEYKMNVAFLSSRPLTGEASSLRISSLDSDPAGGIGLDENSYQQSIVFEENDVFVDGDTLRDGGDHFVWASLYSTAGQDEISFDVTLPEIDLTIGEDVQMTVELIGMLGFWGNNNPHDLELYIDNQLIDNIVFDENGRQFITFDVEPTFFENEVEVTLKVPGTYAYSGDFDRIIIEKVTIDYIAYHPYDDYMYLKTDESDINHILRNFSNANILVYDVSNQYEVHNLSNINIFTEDAGTSYQAEFYLDTYLNDERRKEIVALTDSKFLAPLSLSLNRGDGLNLKSTNNRYDFLIIGEESLIDAAYKLKLHREDEGMRVLMVSLRSIYNQFGDGMETSEAIRDFVNYTQDNWKRKPGYVLLVGDSTNDPLDHNVWDLSQIERSTNEAGTFPTPMLKGSVVDFSSDNYFVSRDKENYLPRIAIGRLPSNNAAEIERYINKVIDFETGEKAPVDRNFEFSFIAGKELGYYEKFKEKSERLIDVVSEFETGRDRTNVIDFYDYGSAGDYRAAVLNLLNSDSSLFINYMGHGASDQWGTGVFSESDVVNLTNQTYPIFVSWNCENTYFHDFDKSIVALGEKLIFSNDAGAIGFLGSTTQTTPAAQMSLANAFYNEIATDTKSWNKKQRLGDYLLRSKNSIGASPYEKDIAQSFSLIGDPTLRMPRSLYGNAPEKVREPVAEESGGGCSAVASNGYRRHWTDGLLEYLFYIFLIIGLSRINRILFFRTKEKS